ncbi:MAG: hypothetical protein ABF370_04070 [Verrucomicrobiales bacterium]
MAQSTIVSEPAPTPQPAATISGSDERPLVLVVLPRLVDLAIQQDRSLAPAFLTQRRASYTLRRERLMQILDLDELGLDEHVRLPPEIVLIAQPRQRRLVGPRGLAPELRTWRLAASALAVRRLAEAQAQGALSIALVHDRILQIGCAAFAEIESVLHRELRLFEGDDLVRIYSEFITLHAELQTFSPRSLDTYFPSLQGRQDEIAALVAEDLAWSTILSLTQPAETLLPVEEVKSEDEVSLAEDSSLSQPLPPLRPNSKRFEGLMNWGNAALARGNAVVSAILYRGASRLAPDEARAERASSQAKEVIDSLVSRLQKALDFDGPQEEAWRESLLELFQHSSRGFWNTNKRLLYDLQKVCIDYERDSYTIDVFGFLRTFGRRPIKRPLPNQREVLMSKHLRNATSRLAKARITSARHASLTELLHKATASAEVQLRRRLRIRIARSLNEKGLKPANIPERVARDKLIEELLDCIVRRGHLSMGDVRDGISRSQLKLSDLTGRELAVGDAILRADRRLDRLLDGVYRRGEFYLRGLQRLSSLGFGRRPGRFLFQYLIVPFVGAFVILEAINIMYKKVRGITESALDQSTTFNIPVAIFDKARVPESWRGGTLFEGDIFYQFANVIPAVVLVGIFLLGLIHSDGFRGFVWAVTQTVFRALKHLLIDFPKWIMSLQWARVILRSRIAKALRRYLLTPLIPTALVYLLATVFVDFNRYTAIATFLLIFTGLDFFFNSTFGRRFEERVGAWIARAWYQFRVQIIRSVFEAIMTIFRQFMEVTERILYAIDEWLLFRTGENKVSMWMKGILGSIWAVVAYGIRFCITLLVEPQINPIKHFPVVTVSHKLLIPMQFTISSSIAPALGTAMANTVAAAIVFLTPGVIGFLVWELKSNWKLYQANRDPMLKPVAVGLHGETVPRLLKPGFHSGTISKLHGKMRRVEQQSDSLRRRQSLDHLQERLRHIEVAIRHFTERELFATFRQHPEMRGLGLEATKIQLLPNMIALQIESKGPKAPPNTAPLQLLFQARSDWLVARVVAPGWVSDLTPAQQDIFTSSLAGIYKLSGVELVDEQIRHALTQPNAFYHLSSSDLEVWAAEERSTPVTYGLRSTWGTIRPHPSSLARALDLPPVNPKQLVFSEGDLPWEQWLAYWQSENGERPPASLLAEASHFVPRHKLLP